MDSARHDKLNELLQSLDLYLDQAKERDKLNDKFKKAESALNNLRSFRRQLSDIFRDPEKAFEVFAHIAIERDAQTAYEELIQDPDHFGKLKGWSLIGMIEDKQRHAILTLSLPIAARAGREGFAACKDLGGGDYDEATLEGRVQAYNAISKDVEKKGTSTNNKRMDLEYKIAEIACDMTLEEIGSLPDRSRKMVEYLKLKYAKMVRDQAGHQPNNPTDA